MGKAPYWFSRVPGGAWPAKYKGIRNFFDFMKIRTWLFLAVVFGCLQITTLRADDLFHADERALQERMGVREQVRQALEKPAPAKRATAWWSQWWAWGSAASAVVAAILIVAVIRLNPPKPQTKEVASVTTMAPLPKAADQPASLANDRAALSRPEPACAKTVRPAPLADGRSQRKDEVAAAAGPPPPPASVAPPPTETRESTPSRSVASSAAPAVQNVGHSQDQNSQNGAANTQNAIVNQAPAGQGQFQTATNAFRDTGGRVAAGKLALTGGFAGGPLRYSLMKRDSNGDFVPVQTNPDLKKGDAVQLRVVPALSGFVSLSQLDRSGTWRRVFPSSGPGIPVVANSPYSLPAEPIEVTDKDEKFRVTLSLATPETNFATAERVIVEQDTKSMKKEKAAPPPQKRAAEPSPLFVDLTIGPTN